MKKLSVSAISTYAICNFKFYGVYIGKFFKSKSNEHFQFGSFGHSLLEIINKDCSKKTFDSHYKFAKKFINESINVLQISNIDEYIQRLYKNSQKIKKRYEVLASELTAEDDDFLGIIDLICYDKYNDSIVIFDYKFSKYKKTLDDIYNNIQLWMYLYLIKKHPKFKKYKNIKLGYITISKTSLDPKLEIITTIARSNILESQMKIIFDYKKQIQFAIDNNIFPKQFGWPCTKCEFYNECQLKGGD